MLSACEKAFGGLPLDGALLVCKRRGEWEALGLLQGAIGAAFFSFFVTPVESEQNNGRLSRRTETLMQSLSSL